MGSKKELIVDPKPKKSELDLTDSKSSEASFCGPMNHYNNNSLISRPSKGNEEEISRKRKPEKAWFVRIFCCFN